MGRTRGIHHVSGFHCHERAQSHGRETATSVSRLLHRAFGGIGVRGHDDAAKYGNVQIAEHVALAERGNQELFRIPPIGVSVEGSVSRRLNRMLTFGRQ